MPITSIAPFRFFRNTGRVQLTNSSQTITLPNPHSNVDSYVLLAWFDGDHPFTDRAKDGALLYVSKVSGSQISVVAYSVYYGFTSCGYTGSNVGTTQRFDDSANTHTNRADAAARHALAGYAMGGYGFSSCGCTSSFQSSVPGVGTTQRFDDNANTHTSKMDASGRYWLTGYAMPNTSNVWFGYTSCGYTSSNVGTTQRFDDSANTHTNRADATGRHFLPGYSMSGYGFTSCGYTGSSNVGTTQRFDNSANTHTNRVDATARGAPAGYSITTSSGPYINYATLE